MRLGYGFTYKYQLPDNIVQADALSRLMDSHRKQSEVSVVVAVSVEKEVCTVLASIVRSLPLLP